MDKVKYLDGIYYRTDDVAIVHEPTWIRFRGGRITGGDKLLNILILYS
jgi:hypothetical protein